MKELLKATPRIEIETSKIMNKAQEDALEGIINEAIERINLTGLRVLSHSIPKMRDPNNKELFK